MSVKPSERVEAVPVIHIRPLKGWAPIHFGEQWEDRDLLRFLAWRDIRVRYKQTALGAAWAVLQLLLTVVVAGLEGLALLVSGAFGFDQWRRPLPMWCEVARAGSGSARHRQGGC